MRHLRKVRRFGRRGAHRARTLASIVCALVRHRRVKTTLAKAKEARRLADRMVTLAKEGTLAARRRAIASLHRPEPVAILFGQIAPQFKDRKGGYTRIVKLGSRPGDGADTAVLEWIGISPAPRPKKAREESESGKRKG